MGLITKIFGDANQKYLKKIQPVVEKINSLEKDFEKIPDERLKGKTFEFKERIKKRESLDNLLPEAFALVREAAKRTLGQRHFDVQMMGGIVLHQGKIAEMKTGEGKTLVATLPLYLNLSGLSLGVHKITIKAYDDIENRGEREINFYLNQSFSPKIIWLFPKNNEIIYSERFPLTLSVLLPNFPIKEVNSYAKKEGGEKILLIFSLTP